MTAVRTYVDRVVATAPPLTADQRERLTGLLRPSVRRRPSDRKVLVAAGQRTAVSIA